MTDESIAIVGASCRFPGAENLDEFWQLLASAGDAVSEIDDRRWSTRFYYHPDRSEPGKSYTWSAGLISGVDLFEPSFFGISPREAAQIDPQQRLLLELAWHAFEDAGIPPSKMSGSATGVYIGASTTDYSDLRIGDPAGADSYFMTGSTLSILANRISYVFDLRGPSLAVDTACSSSLVALHHACEAIRNKRIAAAIVGGINLLLAPYPFIGFSRASMLSRRGRCFAFDERADGYVRGEGGAVIILKPLADAVAAKDRIHAVIRASAVNSDGRTIGLSLPSEAAQASLLRGVYHTAGIAPDDLAFLEMHGTGTAAGDPIEAAAVGHSLGQSRSLPLPIGSVKTNIGHLEPASGMAGLLKAALALDREVIPPTLHCENPNPKIPFETLNLRLVRKIEPAKAPERPYAGVNSFGFGGTNAHVVLARATRCEEAPAVGPLPPLVISAQTEKSLRSLVQNWRTVLAEVSPERAPMLLRAAARGRDHHPQRLIALSQNDPAATAQALGGFLNDEPSPFLIAGTGVREGKLAFVFSGNGAQFTGMGRDALRSNAAFRGAIEELDRMLRPELGWSVMAFLEGGVDAGAMARADIAQPLLFAVQVGIVEALREVGVNASGYLGHSVGEIAAAWAAGALSLGEAGRVVIARSRYQQRTQGRGRMAALALAPEAARDFLDGLDSPAEIAALNATHSVTVSGPSAEIERLEAEAKRRGLWFRPLDLDFAFHSRLMDPIRKDLLENLRGLSSRHPTARLVSTVTGEAVEDDSLDAGYWWRNIRCPVRFTEATAFLTAEGYRIFLEIGPTAILQSYLTDALRAAKVDGRVLTTLSRKPFDGDPFSTIAANCHVAGYDFTQSPLFAGMADPRGLPLYPWDRQSFWFGLTAEGADPVNAPFEHPLLGFRQRGPVPCWINHLDEQVLPWIGDHAIEGVPVFPAAGVLEMACAAARVQWPDAPVLELRDLEVRRPLPFDKGRMREVRAVIGSEEGDWELASRARLSNEPFTVHAVGRLGAETDTRRTLRFSDHGPIRRRIDEQTLYDLARLAGLDYGDRFRTLSLIEITGPDAAIAHLDPSPVAEDVAPYLVHPALLDGALQALIGLLADGRDQVRGKSFLPWRFGRVRFLAPFGRIPRRAELRLTRIGIRSVSADIALYDGDGDPVAELAKCWFRRVELARGASIDERALRVDLVPAPLAELATASAMEHVGALILHFADAREPDPARREQALLLDALIGSIALRSMAHIVDAGRSFRIEELVETGLLAPASDEIAEWALRLLERFGAASEARSEWRIAATTYLPDAEEVWRLLLADAPDLVAELALAAAAVNSLPSILASGPRWPDAILAAMTEHLIHSSPASAAGIGLVCDALEEIAANWPRGRPLRILELGAIGGGATRRVLDRLAQSGTALSYVATSADAEQSARLSFLAESFNGVSACRWSPQDGTEALDQTGFDIILAVNACARLQLDANGFADLRRLLVPNGVFVAVEPEPNPLWDLVFGQGPGWWRVGSRASDASPLRSAEEWCAELAEAGFRSADAASSAWAPWPCTILWGIAPARETSCSDPVEPRSVMLVAGDAARAVAVHDRLSDAGHRVTLAGQANAFTEGLQDQGGSDTPQSTILFLAEGSCPDDPTELASQQIAALARVATQAADRRSELWVITCDAQQSSEMGEASGLVGGAIWSFARVLANEMPRLSLRLVDLPSTLAANDRARQIAAELSASSTGEEIVWTPEGRHVLRVRRGLPPRLADPSDVLTLGSRHPGGLDSLGWEAGALRTVGPGQVEVEVQAAGLNFRDMMWAMGLLPEEALIDGFAGPTFGLECAGIIRSISSDVEGWAVGDRVMGFAPASLGTRVVTMADALASIPSGMSFAAAATIPVTFVTVTYALGHLAKLAPGEHVLVHAAAGGVGLAAIQYAKHCGAVVIATAGSEVKRSFLRLAGADHVLDSRDLGFCNEVREITRGQGVDVVLNSLSGEAMERSLEVLRPFGRFLELGKRDLYLNRRIHLRPLRENISYFAIDIDQLPTRRPDLARDLLRQVSAALSEGAIRPLAHRIFSFGELDDAIRLMQSSGHIGKLVLEPRANAGVRLREPPTISLRRDGTYLVTGGVEGFGFEAARWLAARGAGSIALMGRRGSATPGCDARIGELEAAGAEVRVYRGDVADRASLAGVLEAIRAVQPPLRGIVHAASAIDDSLASEVEIGRLQTVLRPKLGGALALDALTRDDPIELFLLFSSATTLVGAPAQGAYVAANAALEALARQRRAEGRSALTVAWGPIADAGYLAERPETRDALARRLGAKPISAAEALAGLPAMIASGLAVVAFAETNWNEARRFLPILASPMFSEARASGFTSTSDESFSERLTGLDPDAALALLKTVIAEEAATILRLPASGIDPLRPLSEMGMDSLMAVELRLALESRLRVDLPLVSLAEGTSVASIAGRLAMTISTGPKDGDLIALVARHEGMNELPFSADDAQATSAMVEPKSVAAE